MTVAALITELDRRDVRIWVDGERLRCDAPAGALSPELRDQLRERRSEILAFLREPAGLSSPQQRLWYLDQLDPGGPAYVIAQAFEIRGPLDAALLERALAALVVRHESLRTVFANVDGRPLQVVSEPAAWTLPVTPVSGAADLSERLRVEAARGFDLARGPLFRAHLFRLAADAHVLLLAMHHIVADGWSMGILTRDLAELHASLRRGDAAALPAAGPQYRDCARWERRRLADDALQAVVARQIARLAGAPRLALRTDRPRTAAPRRRGATHAFALPIELAARLRSLARQEQVTLFMTLLAGFTALLARYSGQDDLLVGTPVANRGDREAERVVGCFVNTLVLRADLAGAPSVRELLARVREECLDALAHQDLPLEQVVEALRPEREPNRNPLFDVMFTLQSAPAPLDLQDLRVRPVDVPRAAAQFDLMLHVEERADGLAGFFLYDADLFDAATIARMAAHWRALLAAMVATPDRGVSELPMLSERERHQLLVEWNQTAADYPRDACIHELFAAQVERTPQAIAVRCGDEQLTYRELELRSNQLAQHLRRLGVGPDVLVGICVERSVAMVVALLGTLEAGGAYVPIDPGYPAERVTLMLQDAQARVLLTQTRLLSLCRGHAGTTLCLDDDQHALAGLPASAPANDATAASLAYVMYTSGSTGRPKGVCITHRGLVNYVTWASAAYRVADGSGAPLHSSIAFDLTVTSLFPPLLSGRTVELLADDPGAQALAAALRDAPAAQQYSLVKLTPAHLQLLQAQLAQDEATQRTRTLVIGGEQLHAEAVAFWREHAPDTVLVNEYGPTETVVGCCAYRVTAQTPGHGAIPIGRPIANTRVYVLDQHMAPVPIGVVGELYIGGDGVARGYLNRPESTKARFVADPFGPAGDARLYRTGDLARYLPDGNLEFLGRSDDQVKVQGCRVELGEVEATLLRLPQVRAAAVALHEAVPGPPRLIAYVVPRPGPAPAPGGLRRELQRLLPPPMVPSAVVTLDELPLTANGKVDRRALPAPTLARELDALFVPPRSEWELRLAQVWQELLAVDAVGAGDDFFDLGGNSLLLVRMISEINRRHQVSLGVAEALLNPTVAQMAKLIDGRQQRSRRESAVVELRSGAAELPVYFVYASPDEFRVAKATSGRHPVFGIEVPWPRSWHHAVVANQRSGFPTMAQVVAPFVAALTAHAGARPCVLAGHSFGGLLAYEAAREVMRRGGKVELVVLLDTWARPPDVHKIAWHDLWQQWAELDLGSPARLAQSLAARLRGSWRTTRWLLGQHKARVQSILQRRPPNLGLPSTVLDEDGMPVPEALVRRAYAEIARSYEPRPLDCRGVLFRTDPEQSLMMRACDDSNGWRGLFARGLEIVPIVGDHITMVRQHQQEVARSLDEVLQRHWPLPGTNGNGEPFGG